MRASKKVGGRQSAVKIQNSKDTEIHISGAEGLYNFSNIDKVVREYFSRAMSHSRGTPNKVVVTIEKIKQYPSVVPFLPVSTIRCNSPDESRRIISELLSNAGVSARSITEGIKLVKRKIAVHGAALMSSESSVRIETDKNRGVRVSRLGVTKDSRRKLSRSLAGKGIDTITVREAVILASKVASCNGVIAELCVSDDPDYTTGYVASRKFGYVRIPNIKKKGSPSGGRVFFVKEDADVGRITEYLEKKPVIVGA